MDIDDADDAGTGLDEIADAAIDEESNNKTSKRGPQRKLHWKTEYLVYCMYTRCNLSMRRTAALFGIGSTLVDKIRVI